ncbi:Stress-activated map kinase-interacting protein 1 [Grifola frondosa]|uniref:Stress-activated map kinase-interacting protein 1 n=1 Tax=Grifola frondosa TaxID=5627 RepID=A0A1C7MMA2_GRIFR|nr:Stress-activated map kinase-interacting protein 1 [Grifola frondosa]
MSLISDPDFLIHSLRLNYLRNVDDPYGPRLISLDPSYHSNPYIVASGLADTERWPELAMPTSPTPSDDESGPAIRRRHSGFPGATSLKYTTTILGPSRSGALGLRVSGKRASVPRNSFRLSIRTDKRAPQAEQATEGASAVSEPASPVKSGSLKSPVKDVTQSQGNGTAAFLPEDGSSREISPEFVPKFKGAAEMEARRRLRMLARRTPSSAGAKPVTPAVNLNPELSSSSGSIESDGTEEDVIPDEDLEEFDLVADADDSLEMDGDEFDPEFAASRGLGMHSDSASDGISILSATNSAASTSNSFSFVGASSVLPSTSARVGRLSPVSEGRHSEEKSADAIPDHAEDAKSVEPMFEMVMPVPAHKDDSSAKAFAQTSQAPVPAPPPATPNSMFARRPVPPVQPKKSALTAMLAATSSASSSNPFAELYSAISGRAESESVSVRVYFPHAREPVGRALDLKVKKDATVEEVLGFALWSYWEAGWLPKLDEGLDGEEDPKWATKCSAAGWIFRIAEEDGEVDEDFPPPDRTGKMSKFNFDAYAVLEATQSQVQQNKTLESKIQRRLSRVVLKKKQSTGLLNATGGTGGLALPADAPLGTSAGLGSLGSSVGMFPSSLGPSSSHGPPMFLRIRIADTADAGHVSTTIQASGGMYMAEVLDAVCQKRKLSDPKDYALVVDTGTMKMNIPLDRTVRSLQGKRDLILIKRNMLREYGVEVRDRKGGNTDPNASIFNADSTAPEQPFSQLFDFMNAYRKYTVYRKMPMLVTRTARMLAIDGGYIHIIPLMNKAKHVFDSGKTSSYHLKSVVVCQQSSKNSSTFKLVVHSDADRNKRYEFEAENPKLASEIVQTIRGLKAAMERGGTSKQSRRSRHVG